LCRGVSRDGIAAEGSLRLAGSEPETEFKIVLHLHRGAHAQAVAVARAVLVWLTGAWSVVLESEQLHAPAHVAGNLDLIYPIRQAGFGLIRFLEPFVRLLAKVVRLLDREVAFIDQLIEQRIRSLRVRHRHDHPRSQKSCSQSCPCEFFTLLHN